MKRRTFIGGLLGSAAALFTRGFQGQAAEPKGLVIHKNEPHPVPRGPYELVSTEYEPQLRYYTVTPSFDRWLVCPTCGHREHMLSIVRYAGAGWPDLRIRVIQERCFAPGQHFNDQVKPGMKMSGKVLYQLTCPACSHFPSDTGSWQVDDQLSDPPATKVSHYNPSEIVLIVDAVTGEKSYVWYIPYYFQQAVLNCDPYPHATVSRPVIDAVVSGKSLFRFNPGVLITGAEL